MKAGYSQMLAARLLSYMDAAGELCGGSPAARPLRCLTLLCKRACSVLWRHEVLGRKSAGA